MNQKVAICADHAGFTLKNNLVARLKDSYDILDLGAHEFNPDDDYPDFALELARSVTSRKASRGILVCGSGVGACIATNKVPGIRACLCHDTYSAHQGVEHDAMNVLCLGARVVGTELAEELIRVFLQATFSNERRHKRRISKVLKIERQFSNQTLIPHRKS